MYICTCNSNLHFDLQDYSFVVSIPLALVVMVSGLLHISEVLKTMALPSGWVQLDSTQESTPIVLCAMTPGSSSQPAEASITLKVLNDRSWTAFVYGHSIRNTHLAILPQSIGNVGSILQIVTHLNCAQICIANHEECFYSLSAERKGKFKNSRGDVIASMEERDCFWRNSHQENYSSC
jgi:hypothetical protein